MMVAAKNGGRYDMHQLTVVPAADLCSEQRRHDPWSIAATTTLARLRAMPCVAARQVPCLIRLGFKRYPLLELMDRSAGLHSCRAFYSSILLLWRWMTVHSFANN
jgi:hypothetical protein